MNPKKQPLDDATIERIARRAAEIMSEETEGPRLLTVDDIVTRWASFGATRKTVWRLHRRKILRASPIRKRGLLFSLATVRAAEEAMR